MAALLARAEAIATGRDRWACAEFRAGFAARVLAGEDPLGQRYCAIKSAAERRPDGITLTPPPIIDAMLGWAEAQARTLGAPARIIDAGAGTGRFAMAAARRFPDARVLAVENDAEMATLLRANLRAAELDDRVGVAVCDFRALNLEPVAGPTLFIGNPPYVRHHKIAAEWKAWYAETCARHGIAASRLAGLHLHFFARIADIGRVGDFGCLITAAEWLDVGYGAALRALLADGLGGTDVHVLDPAIEAFPGTMSTAAITGFRIGRRPAAARLRGVGHVSGLDRLDDGRTVPWSELSKAPRWSVFIRESPRPAAGTIELGELCRVHRGQVTGKNRVWIAGRHAHGLPEALLKPSVTRAEELIEAEPVLETPDHLARVIDLPANLDDLDEAERAAVERFIRWARDAGAADGYIARHRRPWWSVRLASPAPIVCTYMARRPPAFVRNRAGACLINIAHGLYPLEPLSERQLLCLTASLRQSVRREQGRIYSGGLTKFEPREIERIAIPRTWADPEIAVEPSSAADLVA